MIESDVLVIGSGGAGLRAAVEAAQNDMDVLVVTKGVYGRDCSTIMAGAFAAPPPLQDAEEFYDFGMSSAVYINNPKLMKILTDEAFKRIVEMERFGAIWERISDDTFMRDDLQYPPCIGWQEHTGFMIVKTLQAQAKRLDIRMMDKTFITSLLTSEGRVVGATGLDLARGRFEVFKANSTILATGGLGRLYQETTQPIEITGDGFALAYRAGAALENMEFVQFIHLAYAYPETLKGHPIYGAGPARWFNNKGERFIKRYDPVRMEKTTRDIASRAIYIEVKEGRGSEHGGVYFDYSHLPDMKAFIQSVPILAALQKSGILDMEKERVEAYPSTHYFMGGIRVNERCETSLPGLFATGECTGGVHGANRISGYSLTDIIVFGARAGRYAAEYAKEACNAEIDWGQVEETRGYVFSLLRSLPQGGKRLIDLKKKIQKTMSTYLRFARSREGLEKAISTFKEMRREDLPKISLASEKKEFNLEWKEALEVYNMLDVAEMIARSALLRTESRGAHYREDYPERNDKEWMKNIIITRVEGRMTLDIRPVPPATMGGGS